MATEKAIALESNGMTMIAVVHIPDVSVSRGMVIVIGGPTYRVGPQRMNVEVARELANSGTPVIRFDFRGTGDSDGAQETPRQGKAVLEDIRAAIDCLFEQVPSLQSVALWGLCRGALRSLEYASLDQRVDGVVLLNPRVDSDKIDAVATIRQYYWQRILNPNLYRKIVKGDFALTASVRKLFATMRNAITSDSSNAVGNGKEMTLTVKELVESGFNAFRGRTLIILGGEDLEAEKFKTIMKHSKAIQRRIGKLGFDVLELPGANHTFSMQSWRDQVIAWTEDWMKSA